MQIAAPLPRLTCLPPPPLPPPLLLAGRADFPAFPYPPYDIQLGFMGALYSALEAGGVGLFESPTGVCVCT